MKKETIELQAVKRKESGKQVEELRAKDWLPAVVYGHDFPNENLAVKYSDFERAFRVAGESTLIDLKIDQGETLKVLVHEVQKNLMLGKFLHVDFYKVNMAEKIKTEVEIVFVGEAQVVKEAGGVIVKTLDKLSLECLPNDLPRAIEVDLGVLKKIGDIIRVADLVLPAEIHVLNNPETTVVLAEEMKQEVIKEEVAATTPAEGAELPPTEAEIKAAEKAPEETAEKK